MDVTNSSSPYAVIVGFGIPGRFIAELLEYNGVEHCVIELNAAVADRCKTTPIIVGDAREEAVLRQAGIDRATFVAITLPVEDIVHETISAVRKLRPDVHIIARANYTSAGLKAQTLGADQVVVEEQLAAREFFRLIEAGLKKPGASGTPESSTSPPPMSTADAVHDSRPT